MLAEAAKLKEMGFGAFAPDTDEVPAWCEEVEYAVHCWNWCGGWRPDLWPVYDAVQSVSNWPLLVTMLEMIRDRLERGVSDSGATLQEG